MEAPAVAPSYENGTWATMSRQLSPYADLALGLVAGGMAVARLLGTDMDTVDPRLLAADPLSVAATAVAGLSLAWRRTRPLASFLVFVTGCLLVTLTFHYIGLLSVLLLVCLYSLAAHGRRRHGVTALVSTILIFVGLALLGIPDLRTSDLVQACALLLAAWALGDAIRSRRLQQAGRLRVAQQEAATAREQAALAVVGERLRIARELHDVVAHSMSLIAVQAGVGGHVLRTDVAAAERAFEIIADTSRSALTQTRSMLGLLREENADATSPPVRTMNDLVDLAQDMSTAGVQVCLTVDGTPRPLDPGVELTAYRVIQESLTNVLKHSGADSASVSVVYSSDSVDIEVRDVGSATRPRPASSAGPSGHGLVGLQERARLLGGTLEYGALDDTGFVVSAHLPSPAPEPS